MFCTSLLLNDLNYSGKGQKYLRTCLASTSRASQINYTPSLSSLSLTCVYGVILSCS